MSGLPLWPQHPVQPLAHGGRPGKFVENDQYPFVEEAAPVRSASLLSP